MLWPNSEADDAGAYAARQSCGFQQAQGPWLAPICENLAEDYGLDALCEPGWHLPPALYFREMTGAESAFAEWSCQYVGGSDGVLDSKVDPHTSYGRHGMRRIPDANESMTIPAPQAIHFYIQQFRIVPVAHLGHAVVQEGSVFDDFRSQRLNTFNLHFRRGSFRNHKPALPILTTVQHDESFATVCMNNKRGIIEVFG